jgi:hypothetical protein
MSSLNPFFEELNRGKSKPKVIEKASLTDPSYLSSIRKVRKDKQHDIKFPVDYVMKVKLRTICKAWNPTYKKKLGKPLTQTNLNTLLLRFSMSRWKEVDFSIVYKDTKEYMHTHLFETEYSQRGGLRDISISQDLSDRRVVYSMICYAISWLERGGSIEEIL